MVSQCTKYEVSRFTRYEAMNGSAKCRKWGGLGWLVVLKVIGNVTIRQSAYDFLFDFNRNHASILYLFRDIDGYLWKVADFAHPTCIWRPRIGVTPVEFRGDLWLRNTRVPGDIVWCCLWCDPMFCRFSRTPACDRHRHRQTDGHRPVASTADAQHRAVKTLLKSLRQLRGRHPG